MSLSRYQGKRVFIKKTNSEGTITEAKHKKGSSLGVRFHVTDSLGKTHELHPSDVTILD